MEDALAESSGPVDTGVVAEGEKERPWWLDPRRLPPRTEAALSQEFTPGRVKALRVLMGVGLAAGVVAAVAGNFLTGGLIATSALTQSLMWSADQRKQVLGRT